MIKAVVKFFGRDLDNYGMPIPYYAYWIVASPWQAQDSGVASILPLSTGPAVVVSSTGKPVPQHHIAMSGGEKAAYDNAIGALKGAAAHLGLSFLEHRE